MLHLIELRQPGDQNHRGLADREEHPRPCGIRHAPPWPTGELERPSLASVEVQSLELGAADIVSDAGNHREA